LPTIGEYRGTMPGQARDEADRKLRMDCPYCSLEASDQKVVFRDDLVWFVRDRRYQGALKHSGVIIPIAHRETVFDLTESEVAATFRLLRKVKAWMDADFSPDGYNVGWNCGRVGGQEVFHAHLHVIPRFRQEPLAGQGIRSHLKSEANRW
jgi:histidine triad (HIT) family protein